jgi:hypothetical protein
MYTLSLHDALPICHHAECDGPADHHSKRRFPEVFPTMAEALGEMCVHYQGDYFEGD